MNDDNLPALPEPASQWDDPLVQAIYEILCNNEDVPPPEQHWEGWVARRIADHVNTHRYMPPTYRARGAVIERLQAEVESLRALLDRVVTDVGRTMSSDIRAAIDTARAETKPATDAELEALTGEPHIDGWPLFSGLPPPARKPLTDEQEVLAQHDGDTGRRQWASAGAWLYPGDRLVVLRSSGGEG